MDDAVIKVGFNSELLRMGIRQYVEINLAKNPHLALVGNTGSGKSYALSQILGRVGLIEGSQIWLADFKNSEDYIIAPDPARHRWYGRETYAQAITDFEAVVNARIQAENRDFCRDLRVLCLEEYGSFLNSLDKKESEVIKKSVASILFQARFVNCFIFLCSQRIFAEQLIFGSRDSLCNVILLASPSRQSLQAFLDAEDYKEMKALGQGEGYLIREGKKPLEITVPTITKSEKLQTAILKAVTRENLNKMEAV